MNHVQNGKMKFGGRKVAWTGRYKGKAERVTADGEITRGAGDQGEGAAERGTVGPDNSPEG